MWVSSQDSAIGRAAARKLRSWTPIQARPRLKGPAPRPMHGMSGLGLQRAIGASLRRPLGPSLRNRGAKGLHQLTACSRERGWPLTIQSRYHVNCAGEQSSELPHFRCVSLAWPPPFAPSSRGAGCARVLPHRLQTTGEAGTVLPGSQWRIRPYPRGASGFPCVSKLAAGQSMALGVELRRRYGRHRPTV